jgi:hypothetical protein
MMEHVFICNGETQLVLIPKNDTDTVLLRKLLDEGPVEIDWIRQPVGVLGKSVKDGVIIRRVKSEEISENANTE